MDMLAVRGDAMLSLCCDAEISGSVANSDEIHLFCKSCGKIAGKIFTSTTDQHDFGDGFLIDKDGVEVQHMKGGLAVEYKRNS